MSTWIAAIAVCAAVALAVHRIAKEMHMSAQDTVDQIVAQLGKVKTELVGKIADLEAQVAAGETPDLSELSAIVDSIDAIVPDPVVEPEPETPVEPEVPGEDTPAE